MDIVFVHGIQGGAFSTWRAEKAALAKRPTEQPVSRRICWPGVWLSKDVPQARLLSMKYAAPVTAWQVRSWPQPAFIGLTTILDISAVQTSCNPSQGSAAGKHPSHRLHAQEALGHLAHGCHFAKQKAAWPIRRRLPFAYCVHSCIHCNTRECRPAFNAQIIKTSCMQGESLPVRGTVEQLLDRLTAAGVGQRPVVFVCHRWAAPALLSISPKPDNHRAHVAKSHARPAWQFSTLRTQSSICIASIKK